MKTLIPLISPLRRITALLPTRAPLNIAWSFIYNRPVIDDCTPQQLDSTPDREPETEFDSRCQKETAPNPRPWSGEESVGKTPGERSCCNGSICDCVMVTG
ncbi:hypothetical protein TNCV_1098511, partial [Trichonephila clavipes]